MLTLKKAKELNDSQVTEHHLIIHAKNVMYAMGAMADHFGQDREHCTITIMKNSRTSICSTPKRSFWRKASIPPTCAR